MVNQNGEHEDMLFEEKKKEPEKLEAGMGADGEFSMDALKKWFMRAGGALAVCAAAVLLMAVLMAGKNQKESLIMEVNSDLLMQFSMNRRGAVLKAEGKTARTNETISMDAFQGKSLGIAVGKIFDKLAENNSLGEDGGILISVRRSSTDSKASAQKIVKEVQKQTESELQQKESKAVVYVFEAEEDAKTKQISSEYGISITKASFLKTLIAENPAITHLEETELAGYSSKRLLQEIARRGYTISLEPVVVKTTYEKVSDESTEESRTEETKETEPSEAESSSEQESSAAEETTKSDGLSEMERRRKALEAGESVDWVDQAKPESAGEEKGEGEAESESETSSRKRRRSTGETTAVSAETTAAGTMAAETAAPEATTQAPPETLPAAPETQPVVTETPAVSGTLTPETQVPSYRRGPGFEDPDNHN